jgi:hypothetical protein
MKLKNRKPARIENIEELRRRSGVDDPELREEIKQLEGGDVVRLTFLSDKDPPSSETLSVRITSRRDMTFRGKLASKPHLVGLSGLRLGIPIVFTASDIHSIPKGCVE